MGHRKGHRQVALLAEGVDRNNSNKVTVADSYTVALLAEGVDRNSSAIPYVLMNSPSPSSRRAWIEISCCAVQTARQLVALLAEGVDRNSRHCYILLTVRVVALLAEGVDRNGTRRLEMVDWMGRPPRGGRG